MTKTLEEVEAALLSHKDEQGYKFSWWEWSEVEGSDESIVVPGLGRVRVVDRYDEVGDGCTDISLILKVTHEPEKEDVLGIGRTRLYQKNGYYASFDGTHWDGAFFEVRAESRTVTIYQKVKR